MSPPTVACSGFFRARAAMDSYTKISTRCISVSPGNSKWVAPFFIERRFLLSYSANKAHLNFAPSQAALECFREEAERAGYKTTQNYLQVPYDEALPEALIRKIAKYQLKLVKDRKDESFW